LEAIGADCKETIPPPPQLQNGTEESNGNHPRKGWALALEEKVVAKRLRGRGKDLPCVAHHHPPVADSI